MSVSTAKLLFDPIPGQRTGVVPRDYQVRDHDESFRLWGAGEIGVLTRSATGTGKTLMACLKADTWLARGDNQRVMIVSYERQLVWQFAEEVEAFLGISPGIEMGESSVDPGFIPKVIVASRQTLMPAPAPTPEQLAELVSFGVPLDVIGAASARHCKTAISSLKSGDDADLVVDQFRALNRDPLAHEKAWSRLHKFDWRLNWMLVFDEAHKHAYHLATVRPIVDWFERNPEHRRNGITATPKRGDLVSIGSKMFPAISLDYPLCVPGKPCAVNDGWAVPYVQRYIEVEGVDFKSLPKIGDDFDEDAVAAILNEEGTLAKITQPLLDMVSDRRTLIFTPSVDMAANVSRFINARVEVVCGKCGLVQWHPQYLVGDGASCRSRVNGVAVGCGELLDQSQITKSSGQAKCIDGSIPEADRKVIYAAHQSGEFQFLVVCGLCREGYNDPDISCVAIFRPVSKKASSLAEQMKGRGCRPLRGLLNGITDREKRLAAIAESEKPNCLIVDLVGITGLADCASTVQIYAEGMADEIAKSLDMTQAEAEALAAEIAERAEEIIAERAKDGEVSVQDALAQAKKENDDAREKIRLEREEAERRAVERAKERAKAGADVSYTTNDVGVGSQVDPEAATDKQYRFMAFLGMDIKVAFSKRKAGRIIGHLRQRMPFAEVARLNGLDEDAWHAKPPSQAQIGMMRRNHVDPSKAKTPYDASLLIDASIDPDGFAAKRISEIEGSRRPDDLTAVGMDLKVVASVLPIAAYTRVVEAGRAKRQMFGGSTPDPQQETRSDYESIPE